jgi:hypothetical protein
MALPIQTTPTFNLVIPSTEKKVRFRPFLVKEEKALLIAQQSEDPTTMIDTLKEIMSSCILDKVDVDRFATFDMEYIFTQIRSKSVGETVELLVGCDTDHGEQNDKAKVKIVIDLSTIKVEKSEDHSSKIHLFEDVGVVMKYPTIDIIRRFDNLEVTDVDSIFSIIADSIDYIYQGDEVFHAHETPREEIIQFLNNLTNEQFKSIHKFFQTMPKIRKEIDYKCPLCGREHHKVLEGLQSFF